MSRALTLALVACILGLAGCSPNECPEKGWMPDRCVDTGEFRFNEKVLFIPNKPPNKYAWNGSLVYQKDSRTLNSPSLAVYWRSNEPAGGSRPVRRPDLVLFSLSYSEGQAQATSPIFEVERVELVDVESPPALPFAAPPGLQMKTWQTSRSRTPTELPIYFVGPETNPPKVLLSCPEVSSSLYARGLPMCGGWFYPQPGLRMRFYVSAGELKDWQALITYLTNLVATWEKKT